MGENFGWGNNLTSRNESLRNVAGNGEDHVKVLEKNSWYICMTRNRDIMSRSLSWSPISSVVSVNLRWLQIDISKHPYTVAMDGTRALRLHENIGGFAANPPPSHLSSFFFWCFFVGGVRWLWRHFRIRSFSIQFLPIFHCRIPQKVFPQECFHAGGL